MAHFPAQHVVRRIEVAVKIYASYVGPFTRINEELDFDLTAILDFRNARDRGEVVPLITQTTGQVFLGSGHQGLRIDLPFPNQQETLQVRLGQHQVAGEPHLADGEAITLGNVGGDVNRFHVRGYGYLG